MDAYLLSAIARVKSTLKKCYIDIANIAVDCLETEAEKNLVRKLTYISIIILQVTQELVQLSESINIASRQLTIIFGTLNILETRIHLLSRETRARM
jgi:hypothetical protein